MAGGVGHTGGLTNPRPWCGRCRAGYSNTGGPPLPRKRAPLQKKIVVSAFCICFVSPSKLVLFITESRSYIVILQRSSAVLCMTICRSWAQYFKCDFVGSVHQLTWSSLISSL